MATPPQTKEVSRALPGPLAPRIHVVLARLAPGREEAFWRGDPAGQRTCVLVCAVAAVTLWVTASAHGSKRSVNLTRRGSGFCFAPGRSAPDSWQLARSRHRPEELVICACGGACAPPRGRRHQLPPSVPRSPGIIPVALRRVFHAAVVSTVLSRNKANRVRTPGNGKKKSDVSCSQTGHLCASCE